MSPASSSARLTVLLGVLFALTPLGTDTFLPFMPAIATAFDAGERPVQLSITTFFAGIALGQLLWGPLSDRYGRRTAFAAGLSVFCASSVAAAFSPSIEALVLLRMAQGFGVSCGPVVARSVVRDLHAHEQAARLLSSMMVVFGVVPIVAPLVGGALLALGWSAVFWLHAVTAAAILVWMHLQLAETAPAARVALSPTGLARSYRAMLSDDRFLAPVAVFLGSQISVVAYIASAAFVFVRTFGLEPLAFAVLFAVVMLAQIAGAFLSRRLVVHRGIARMLRVGTLAALAGSLPMTGLALWGAGHWLSVAAPIALVLFSASILMPNTTAAAMTPFARHAGAAASLLGFLQSATNVLVSGALAALYDGSARPLALTVALGALVSAASLPWALRVLARKDA